MFTKKRAVCSITTPDHLPHTLALRDSVLKNCPDTDFCILITEDKVSSNVESKGNTFYFSLDEVKNAYIAPKIIKKYKNSADKLRWCLKPVFMHFLLSQEKYEQIIYADNDIFFFNDFSFLFEALITDNVFLCPHWRCNHPHKNTNWFLVNFTDGFYNAGFIGANADGIKMLEWWADVCLFKCAKVLRKGLFDDQKYLDFVPLLFEKTAVIKHRGCNVAYWNQIENARVLCGTDVLINGQWPIVCVHFSKNLIKSIISGKDPLLKDFLNRYNESLANYRNQ
ncbi:MAG: glycosyltransferase [Bacteroidales bacterium]|nr:glycosyltransferase [Bacteroidales bacterium]